MYQINVEYFKQAGYGHCGELTKAAFCEGVNNPHVSSLDYCSSSIGKHALLVIGRRKGSDPADMSTWDDDAVICDAWANKRYSIAEFSEMQKMCNNVKYSAEFYRPENSHLFVNKISPDCSYLAGRLEVQYSWQR
jgi:hypothetical protein